MLSPCSPKISTATCEVNTPRPSQARLLHDVRLPAGTALCATCVRRSLRQGRSVRSLKEERLLGVPIYGISELWLVCCRFRV